MIARREFMTLLGGAAAAWPIAARAQQPLPVIGYLNSTSPTTYAIYTDAFREGLLSTGYVEGVTVAIEYRWADGRNDRLPALAAELVRQQVAVIVATGATASAVAAKAATRTIPIVFISGGDPVQFKLVDSFNRPGGNLTGVSFLGNRLASKQLDLLQQLTPGIAPIGVLVNPTNPTLAGSLWKEAQEAADTLGVQVHLLNASTEEDFVRAFDTLKQLNARALIIGADGFFTSRIEVLARLAAINMMPAICSYREFSKARSFAPRRICVGRRSRRDGAGRQPCFSWRKSDWHYIRSSNGNLRKAAGDSQRDCPECETCGGPRCRSGCKLFVCHGITAETCANA